ncbi:MAG: head-tail connector protein [Bacteroidia bacterium]|nr:head-tail connector protein [Bacteroidia bacterium]
MELSIIKQHLYVEHSLDDTLITHYSDAAEHSIASYTHSTYNNLNKSHEQAKLLLIGTWYSFRENEITLNITELPMGIKFLLDMEMSVVI